MASSNADGDERVASVTSTSPLSQFLQDAWELPPDRLEQLGPMFAAATGARAATILIADYAHRVLVRYGVTGDGQTGDIVRLDGTVAGRMFASGEPCVVNDSRTVWFPLTDGEERFGAVELRFDEHVPNELGSVAELVQVLMLVIVAKRRYTDTVLRARRTRSLSAAAEIQWDLLPPLSGRSTSATISGRLDPAYTTGGDSFDYAFSGDRLDFALIDAVGHGLPAVLKSVAAIGAIRNARRELHSLEEAYLAAGEVLESQFGNSFYVTGVIASLDLVSGELRWINAGHPLPLLVRDGHLVGELACKPSLPAGLGGTVREIACEALQPGDKVLFYTDGVTEARSGAGKQFGSERLGELFVRATLDGLSTPELGRRLSDAVCEHCNGELADDAATVIVEYHPQQST